MMWLCCYDSDVSIARWSTSTRYLDISSNQLGGTIPNDIGRLVRIAYVDVRF